jgi:hypothetical protein
MFCIKTLGAVCFAMMLTAVAAETVEAQSPCTFAGDSELTGSGGPLFNQTPKMTLRSTNSVIGGVWRTGSPPQTVWYGDMTDQGYPNAPIQLQIYGGGSGYCRQSTAGFL